MTNHPYDAILFQYENHVATITLNRPDKLNSFTEKMHQELAHAFDFIERQADLRGVIITGSGRGFCAGQDLQDRPPLPPGQKRDLAAGLLTYYSPLILRMRALRVPVIAFVNGVAAGAGASFALACDVIYASASARFIQAFSKIGLLPDAGGTYFLPRLIGTGRALAASLFAEPITATQAQQWGMVWQVIPDDLFAAELQAMQQRLASAPTQSFAASKQAIYASSGNTLQEQLALEAHLQQQLGYTEDYQEGVRAFIEKRPATFTGR